MSQEPSGDPALDDDFSGYFRPIEPKTESITQPPAEDGVEDLAEPPAEGQAGTGRLFRSAGVQTTTEAIPAMRADQARKLRTAKRDDSAGADQPELVIEGPDETRSDRRRSGGRKAPGLRPGAVYVVDIGVTVLFAFIDVLIRSDGLGWITGLGMLIAAIYTALVVRQSDWVVTLIAPPIAFLVAAVTAGQLDLGPGGDAFLNRIAHVFFTLGGNWYWIVLAVGAAFAIRLGRQRRRSRP